MGGGGGTNGGFLRALYAVALERQPDPVGEQIFGQALTAGVPPMTVATILMQSTEARQVTVQSWYRRFLCRPADPGGLQAFVSALQAGMREEVAMSVLIGSEEYQRRA